MYRFITDRHWARLRGLDLPAFRALTRKFGNIVVGGLKKFRGHED